MARTALYFDLMGTLIDPRSDVDAHYNIARRIIDMYDLEDDPSRLWAEVSRVVEEITRDRHISFVPFREAYMTAFSKVLLQRGHVPTRRERERLWRLFIDMHARHLRTTPMAGEVLELSRRKFDHLGVITDSSTDEVNAVLRSLGISHFFDSITTSDEAGVGKPNPRIFRLALSKAGFPPHAFYVGDDPFRDLKGAKDAGFFVILVGDAESPIRPDARVKNLISLMDLISGLRLP